VALARRARDGRPHAALLGALWCAVSRARAALSLGLRLRLRLGLLRLRLRLSLGLDELEFGRQARRAARRRSSSARDCGHCGRHRGLAVVVQIEVV